jgi:hypothetical protein
MVRGCPMWWLTTSSEATTDATSASSAGAAGGSQRQSDQGCFRTLSPAPASVVGEAPRTSWPFAEVDEMAELVGSLMRNGDHARKFGLDIREFEPMEAVQVRPGGTKVAGARSET